MPQKDIQQERSLEEARKEVGLQRAELARRDIALRARDEELSKSNKELARLTNELKKRDDVLAKMNHNLRERGDELARRTAKLKQKDLDLAKRDLELANMGKEITVLKEVDIERRAETAALKEEVCPCTAKFTLLTLHLDDLHDRNDEGVQERDGQL